MNRSPYQRKDSKSFYVLLSVSILAVIAASLGVTLTAKKIHSSSSEETGSAVSEEAPMPYSDEYEYSDVGEANKHETGIVDERKTEEFSESTEPSSEEVTVKEKSDSTEKSIENEKKYYPVGTAISKDFSDSVPVKSKTMNDYRIHNGVDFSAESGTQVRAVCSGKVQKTGTDPSWGAYVEILHGNVTVKYCGLDTIEVREGESVRGNDSIGTLGIIPVESADSTHLHLEAVVDGTAVDPIGALGLYNTEE